MSPSEIGFLAFGLILGTTVGATLLAVVRPRSPLRPVVRVTVMPHALAPRGGIGVMDSRPAHLGDVTPGSPDDDAHLDSAGGATARPAAPDPARPSPGPEIRTRVPSDSIGLPARAVVVPVVGDGRPASGPLAEMLPAVAVAASPGRSPGYADSVVLPLPTRVDVGRGRVDVAIRARPPVEQLRPVLAPSLVAIPITAGRSPAGGSGRGGAARGDPAPRHKDQPAADPCADERASATDACAAADAARDAARALADQLRTAQRAHADLQARVEEAGALADPRRLGAEKERLHAEFQAVHGRATTAEDAEAAAREWLTSVSAANSAAQDAARRVQAGTDELRSQASALEKLDLEANAARISAERTEAACRAAREALAGCEERQRPAADTPGEPSSPLDAHWPGSGEPGLDRGSSAREAADAVPVILRVLRGDAAARERLVASLAGTDAAALADWHVRIARFVDAVTARAIEDGWIDVDEDNPFWLRFTSEEQRDIVRALAALGFRFDGMRGFTDGRVPSARDLSLAVGYAGLDRMRIRTWPGDAALAGLFEGAADRADLWLADQADDLALGRVEAALGARAAGLDDLWDAWGRVRPAMLEER